VILEWSPYALADRNAIFDYIEADNPRAAIRIDNRIRKCVNSLARFPEMGRKGRIEQTRELVISGTPYVAGTGFSANG
jgi:toxin ParE1/3/4